MMSTAVGGGVCVCCDNAEFLGYVRRGEEVGGVGRDCGVGTFSDLFTSVDDWGEEEKCCRSHSVLVLPPLGD